MCLELNIRKGERAETEGVSREWREVKACLGYFSSRTRTVGFRISTSSIVLVLVIDSLDHLASAVPTDASLAVHAALRSPNQWR
jgi:hypothetical protein